MFDVINDWLSNGRQLALLAFIVAVIAITVMTAVKTKSTPQTLGVLIGGVVALAILVQIGALASLIGDEIPDNPENPGPSNLQEIDVDIGRLNSLSSSGGDGASGSTQPAAP